MRMKGDAEAGGAKGMAKAVEGTGGHSEGMKVGLSGDIMIHRHSQHYQLSKSCRENLLVTAKICSLLDLINKNEAMRYWFK